MLCTFEKYCPTVNSSSSWFSSVRDLGRKKLLTLVLHCRTNVGTQEWWLFHVSCISRWHWLQVLTVLSWAGNQSNSSPSSLRHIQMLNSTGAAHSTSKKAWGDWATVPKLPSVFLHTNFLCHSTCILKALFFQASRNRRLILRKPTYCRGLHSAILFVQTLVKIPCKPNPPSPLAPVFLSSCP